MPRSAFQEAVMYIKEKLKKGPFLFDGAMGTYYSQLSKKTGNVCEEASLSDPGLILDIHREYIEAGADAITSNTFSANRLTYGGDEEKCRAIIEASWKIALKAVEGTEVIPFASIGPVNSLPDAEKRAEEYKWLADRFLEIGAKHFIFETFSQTDGLAETAEYIKKKDPESFIIICFSINADGFTREGMFAGDLLFEMAQCGAADVLGFNCGVSAGRMMEIMKKLKSRGLDRLAVALIPNAGYPVVVNNRAFYEGDPFYFAGKLAEMARKGAQIVGGCCGTTPVHIAEVRKLLDGKYPSAFTSEPRSDVPEEEKREPGSAFWRKLENRQRVFAVELDPPADTDLTKFMNGVRDLKAVKADIITIADCPIGRARMDSSLLACKITREEGIEALPHMTCRDRNLNATKALVMGQYAEGIRNILIVTGDPVPTAERDEVKSVYQFNSRKMAAFMTSLNERMFPNPMHLFGALNVNARNFDIQLRLAKAKQKEGITGFLTQPVLTPEAFENLKRARTELSGYILGGIIPVVSERNARFMNNEIAGINVDERVVSMYAGKSREESEELAIRISAEIAGRIIPYTDGFYIMTPFQRTGLVSRIIAEIRKVSG